MQRNTLRRIAQELWGYRGWPFDLARATSYHPVTIAKWAAGMTPITPRAQARILAAMEREARERRKRLTQLLSDLKNRVDSEISPKSQINRRKRQYHRIPPWKRPLQVPDFPEF